eukprot:TRINITY_DN13797_c0_g1_i2.p1 TRINITY_DN13797_c0_g1~~TRINITY_DN13797_c0_g1_i2.p1  ORF type:complete len:241 (+),score=80.35 TRINITY_DN13797_c0_g1_i2:732-1454(+)
MELQSLLNGPSPKVGVKYLCTFNLHNILFSSKTELKYLWNAQETNLSRNIISKLTQKSVLPEEREAYYLSALFLPLTLKSGTLPFSKFQMREEWRMDTKTVNNIELWCSSWKKMDSFYEQFLSANQEMSLQQVASVGMFLRELGPSWEIVKEFCAIMRKEKEGDSGLDKWEPFIQQLQAHNLIGVNPIWTMKPYYNGGELKAFGFVGKQIQKMLEMQIEWLIIHPQASKEDCYQWIIKNK